LSGSRCSPSLYVGPRCPYGGVPMLLPGATCDVHLDRMDGAAASVSGGLRALRQEGQREPLVRLAA
jgi:hypothetical protein